MTRQEYLIRREVGHIEGRNAYRIDLTRRDCPHSVYSIKRQHWFYGWQLAKDLDTLIKLLIEKEKQNAQPNS